jgi:hypothetical protein
MNTLADNWQMSKQAFLPGETSPEIPSSAPPCAVIHPARGGFFVPGQRATFPDFELKST